MEIQQINYLLRQYRHDYGNVLQVIDGYLDLASSSLADSPPAIARVKQYVKQEMERWHEEHRRFTCLPDHIRPYLLYQQAKLRELGIEVIYQEVDLPDGQWLAYYDEPYTSVRKLVEEIKADSLPVVYLTVHDQASSVEMLLASDASGVLQVHLDKTISVDS